MDRAAGQAKKDADMNAYDAAQTELCNKVNARVQSILELLKDALNGNAGPGTDKLSDILDSVITDAQAAQVLNDRLLSDEVL